MPVIIAEESAAKKATAVATSLSFASFPSGIFFNLLFSKIMNSFNALHKTLEEEIGALIFTSDQASAINLIDDELYLEELVNKIVKDNNLKDYRVIKLSNTKNSLVRQILSSNSNKKNHNMKFECLSLRSSMTAILSFESTGC